MSLEKSFVNEPVWEPNERISTEKVRNVPDRRLKGLKIQDKEKVNI